MRPIRRRPTIAAAAAPNRTSIGGAGTSVGGPPEVLVEVEVEPPVEVEDELDDDVEEEVDDEVELEVEVELLVDDDDEVDEDVLLEVETLPELVEVELEVETLPLLVETLPELVELELPPELVLVDPPDELVEPPEVLVEPVLVEVITTLPPEEPPPPKNPPKKPPPKPPPQPPPITTGPPPPPPVCGGSGGSIGMAAIAICGAGSHVVVVRVMTRRMRLTWRCGTARWARCGIARFALGAATLACFTYCGFVVLGASATCTAPPPSNAPPAAVAASFTRAVRTDINLSLVIAGGRCDPPRENPAAIDCPALRNAESACYDNCVNRVWSRVFAVSCPAAGQRGQPVPLWHRLRRAVYPPASNSPVWLPLGGARPRCCQPRSLRQRPRAVRATRPSWMR